MLSALFVRKESEWSMSLDGADNYDNGPRTMKG
jgi:hypothetical protein